jgi:hypothetical protein
MAMKIHHISLSCRRERAGVRVDIASDEPPHCRLAASRLLRFVYSRAGLFPLPPGERKRKFITFRKRAWTAEIRVIGSPSRSP